MAVESEWRRSSTKAALTMGGAGAGRTESTPRVFEHGSMKSVSQRPLQPQHWGMCKSMNFSLLTVGRIQNTTAFISIFVGMRVYSVEMLAMFE